MAGWISSKLKEAEHLLHKIDQQAAGSLRKNEKLRSEEELGLETLEKPSENRPLIKEQLKKKTIDRHDSFRSGSDHTSSLISASSSYDNNDSSTKEKVVSDIGLSTNSNPSPASLTDSDWTQLLSAPVKKDVPREIRSASGGQGARVVSKDGKKKSSLRNVVALEAKRGQKGQSKVLRGGSKSDIEFENKVNGTNGRPSISVDATSTSSSSMRTSTSSVESRNDKDNVDTRNVEHKDVILEHEGGAFKGQDAALDGLVKEIVSHPKDNDTVKYEPSANHTSTPDKKKQLNMGLNEVEKPNIERGVVGRSVVASKMSSSTKRSSPLPSESSSGSESSSSSDSELEHEREERRRRRQQILAEKAAAKAVEAIKAREDKVARLEGEKQSLEKIIEEQTKEQVVEASKLQTTMMQAMEAVEQEKQKHNYTRMEALARLIKLESTHADLTRSLASAQKNLEVEINKVTDLRQQVDLKQASLEALRRKISSFQEHNKDTAARKEVEFEKEMLETEYSFLTDKVGRLQEKAKTLERSIESTERELQNPTELETEIKRRLSQLTDRLIQKQAQVEALSSQKAMVQFRIEAVSRSLDEKASILGSADIASTSSRGDVEAGVWKLPNAKVRHTLEEQIRSGKQHLGSFVLQLDYLFCTGAVFLRRNSKARAWALVYFVSLHIWVIYILMSHSSVSNDASSGAVVSLENLNKTGSV